MDLKTAGRIQVNWHAIVDKRFRNGLSLWHHIQQRANRLLGVTGRNFLRLIKVEPNPWIRGYSSWIRLHAHSKTGFSGQFPWWQDISSPEERAAECASELGVYPISFAYIPPMVKTEIKERLISSQIPGDPYSFSHESEYLDEYRGSVFAMSPKKAGWETQRTLEILFASSTPLLSALPELPRYCLSWHPLSLYALSTAWINSFRAPIPKFLQRDLAEHANKYLTSAAQAQYIAKLSELTGDSVVVIDSVCEKAEDYLKASIIHGFVGRLGDGKVISLGLPEQYLDGSSANLEAGHGLGFGTSRFLKVGQVREVESDDLSGIGQHDWIVVRCEQFPDITKLDAHLDAMGSTGKRVYIFGGDEAISREGISKIRSALRGEIFIREFATS